MMKRLTTVIGLAAASLLLMNCSAGKSGTASAPARSDADKVAEVKEKYTDQQMEQGRDLWSSNCNKCHKLYTPESRTVKSWENVLPRMVKRAKLDDAQAGMVRAYLISHAASN